MPMSTSVAADSVITGCLEEVEIRDVQVIGGMGVIFEDAICRHSMFQPVPVA